MVKGKWKSRLVHLNVLKRYLEKEECVKRLVVWMEDEDERIGRAELVAENFCQEELDRVLINFDDVLSIVPGKTSLVEMTIDVGDANPIGQTPYRLPESIREKVRVEVRYQARSFYMPTLDKVISEIGSCQVSQLDLTKGYYQIGLAAEDMSKTAFVCPYGKYEFSRMPFGLMNVPSVFQRLMEQVLLGYRDFCRPYLDDVVVYSASWE